MNNPSSDHDRLPGGRRPVVLALSCWVVLVVGTHVAARVLFEVFDIRVFAGAAPLQGRMESRFGPLVLIPLVVGAVLVWFGPVLASRLRWRTLLLCSVPGAVAWAVALALVDGPGALPAPLRHGSEYLRIVPGIESASVFVETFVERIGDYPTHVRGHPPGFVLLLWAMRQIGLGGARWAAGLVIAGGAAGVPAVLLALRELAGEARARAAAPFLVLAPAAIWVATSANGFYLGVAAWGIALVVLATGRAGVRGDLFALGGGVVCGIALHLTYGMLPLGAVVLVVAAWRRRWRPLVVGGLGIVAVVVVFVASGFWWLDGLDATREQYWMGLASQRPYAYYVFANLGAFALAVGPATAAGLARLRHRETWLLVGGALVAVAASNFSGLSKGEVERIWLHFAPWVIIAATALVVRQEGLDVERARGWIGLQAAAALALQVSVNTPW